MTEPATTEILPVYDPMTAIEKLIDRGITPEQLEKFLDVQKQWMAQQAKTAFDSAMTECQAEMPKVLKDAENPHTRSRFARLETVLAICSPVITKHGFSLSFGTTDCTLPNHARIICDIRHKAGHTERFQADIPLDGIGSQGNKSAMNACQATGSTYSYGRRYLMLLAFNLHVTGEDNDGAGAGAAITEAQVKQLQNLLADTNSDTDKFLEWAKVGTLAEMPTKMFASAVALIEKKRKDF